MRLESALSASKEGINVHGQGISVVSDNISNSNTTGYKVSRAEFRDILAASDNTTGCMTLTGCGAALQNVKTIFNTGTIEATGRTLDLAIAGDGFFLIGDPAKPKFTRAGNFQISDAGFLITSDGDQVLGAASEEGGQLQPIDMYNVNGEGEATTQVKITGNLRSSSDIVVVPESPETFKDLNSVASFSTSVEVYDSLGAAHNTSLYFYKTDTNTWQVQAYVNSSDTSEEGGKPVLIGEASLKFDGNGQLTEGSETSIAASVTFTGAQPSNITIDLSGMTQFANGSGLSNVTRDGQAAGSIIGYKFARDGNIYAELTSGNSIQIGKLQLGNVQNLDGLKRAGNNVFEITQAAGELVVKNPSDELGTIEGSCLELSTVDLSTEFVNLVILQRGYQANSSAFSNVSSLLQEAIALLR